MTHHCTEPLVSFATLGKRRQLYMFILFLTAASVPFIHIYLNIELSATELAIHTLGIVVAMGIMVAVVEPLIRTLLPRYGHRQKISMGGYWLLVFIIFLLMGWTTGAIHEMFPVTRVILHKHLAAGYEDMPLRILPLALLIGYLTLLWIRSRDTELQLDGANQLNRELENTRIKDIDHCDRVAHTQRALPEGLTLKQKGVEFALVAESITRIQVDENYCHVWVKTGDHTDGKRYIMRMTLAEVLGQLPAAMFMQVHRSHVVNLRQLLKLVRKGRSHELQLSNGDSVPVSRTRIKQVRERLLNFSSASTRPGKESSS